MAVNIMLVPSLNIHGLSNLDMASGDVTRKRPNELVRDYKIPPSKVHKYHLVGGDLPYIYRSVVSEC